MKEQIPPKEQIPQVKIEQIKWRNFVVESIAKFHKKADVRGFENIPLIEELLASGVPVIGVCNHLGHPDGPLIATEIRKVSPELAEDIDFVMGSVIKGNYLTNFLLYAYNGVMIPSHRKTPDQHDAQAWDLRDQWWEMGYEAEKDNLRSGKFEILFAEGGRSRTGGIREVSEGIAKHLRLLPNIHIVPIGVWGTEKILPPDTKIPIPRFYHKPHMRIGRPIAVSELEARIGLSETMEANDRKLVTAMMGEVAVLLPDKYRGHYGGKAKD